MIARILAVVLIACSLMPGRASAEDAGLYQVRAVEDLSVQLWIAPSVFQPTGVEVQLADASGAAPADVRRVDLSFAMAAMNHGAVGIEAEMAAPGTYQAAGYFLAMPGWWWLALRVERADGRLQSARFLFEAPPSRGPTVANMLYQRPDGGVQVQDVAVSPEGVIPKTIGVTARRPVRLEVIYVDDPPCGGLVDAGGASAAVSWDGLAELSFTPAVSGPLELVCASNGLLVRPVGG
jgi:hypothetical protein